MATEVTRRYRVVHDRNLTLKETILRRRRRVVGDDFWALKGVTLHVPPGQSLGIVGRNGSGKSTLLEAARRNPPADDGGHPRLGDRRLRSRARRRFLPRLLGPWRTSF